jgi:membrane fusion protein, heavy metal efflux system
MKHLLLCLLSASALSAQPVILDPNTVANLRLEFASAEPRLFEETAFALGRIEAAHASQAAVASRISGRVVGLTAHLGDTVTADAPLVRVESRQAGDPPPVITLTAPIAGTITTCAIHLGDPVEPSTALLEITDLSTVEAIARVPEALLGRLTLGQSRTRIRLTAFPGETFTGTLTRLGTEADPATGTVAAHFRLPDPEGRLRPGLRAEFALILSARPEILAVPRAAIQGEGVAPRVVFTRDLQLPTAFVKTPVVLGAANDTHVEIVSGLFTGDEVVTTGAYALSFAGGGTLSLKEALDAAHGHEHAADGSELKDGASSESKSGDHSGHDHESPKSAAADSDHDHSARPWQIATVGLAVLAAILGYCLAAARRRAPAVVAASATPSQEN